MDSHCSIFLLFPVIINIVATISRLNPCLLYTSFATVGEKTGIAIFNTIADYAKGATGAALGISIASVSYTHLDVYKRQLIARSIASGSEVSI